ncbi:MAG: methionyl-tRNA formyltransferase [Candidatus Magasanikbacteria bacterium]|nr:methionyl-tRNA formyltransferase [Candidatus Magasanikbacteria bacterium]
MATRRKSFAPVKRTVFISMNRFGHRMLETLREGGIPTSHLYTLFPEQATQVSDYQDFRPLAARARIPYTLVKHIRNHGEEIARLKPDLIFVFGWSQILPKEFLTLPRLGCLGSHPAILPRNRGRAAIPWHFINEERYGGLTFFFLGEGCDDGDIIAQARFPLRAADNARTYYERIMQEGAVLLRKLMPQLRAGQLPRRHQDERRATYLLGRTAADSALNFKEMSSREIFNLVRAVAYVYPAAFAYYEGKKVLFHQAQVVTPQYTRYSATIGQVAAADTDSVVIKARDGFVKLSDVRGESGEKLACIKVFKVGHHFNR